MEKLRKQQDTPCIIRGEGDTLARSVVKTLSTEAQTECIPNW